MLYSRSTPRNTICRGAMATDDRKLSSSLLVARIFNSGPGLKDKGPPVQVEAIDFAVGGPGRRPEFARAFQALPVVLLAGQGVVAADDAAVLLEHVNAPLIQQRRSHSAAAGRDAPGDAGIRGFCSRQRDVARRACLDCQERTVGRATAAARATGTSRRRWRRAARSIGRPGRALPPGPPNPPPTGRADIQPLRIADRRGLHGAAQVAVFPKQLARCRIIGADFVAAGHQLSPHLVFPNVRRRVI